MGVRIQKLISDKLYFKLLYYKIFIMQVRRSLHTRNTIQKNKLSHLNPKVIEKAFHKNKKVKKKKIKSKSKSHSKIQDKSYRRTKQQFNKSPFKVHQKQSILYTSPKSQSKQKNHKKLKSRSPLTDISSKRINTQREHEKLSHGISTKIHTDRSPLIIRHQYIQNEHPQHKDKITIQKFTQKTHNQKSSQKNKKHHKRTVKKKKIPQIKTALPERKQSYFDALQFPYQLSDHSNPTKIEQFSWQQKSTFQTHFVSSKKPYSSKQGDNTFDFPLKNKRFKTQTNRQFATSTSQIKYQQQIIDKISKLQRQQREKLKQNYQNQLSLKEIQLFRKEQELKWKIIALELQDVKNRFKISDKLAIEALNSLVEQSQKNMEELHKKPIKVQIFNKKNYIVESPKKVMEALRNNRNRRNSQQQSLSIIKSVSSKKLIEDLQFMKDPQRQQDQSQVQKFYIAKHQQFNANMYKKQNQPFDSNITVQKSQQYSSSKSFCLEFEKQLQNYTSQQHKNEQFYGLQLEYIPQLEYGKALEVVNFIQDQIFEQLCKQIMSKEYLLNNILILSKGQNFDDQKIQANNTYAERLTRGFFRFLLKKENTQKFQQFIHNLNIPYGNSPQICLKWLRNYFSTQQENQNQQDDFQDIVSPVTPILSIETISQYDVNNYTIQSQSQYFFNHCVYSCLNQLLDKHRPYGQSGLPPLCRKPPKQLLYDQKSVIKVMAKIQVQFEKLIKSRIGRQDYFTEYNQQIPQCQIQSQYQSALRQMDEFIIQSDERWQALKKSNNIFQGVDICEQYMFENKYTLNQIIQEQILNEEVLMLFNDFSL